MAEPVELNLAVASDLSEYAYNTARELIDNHIIENTDYSKPGSERYYMYRFYSLHVGFWDSDTALAIMAKMKDCNVVIEKNRDMGSWRLTTLNQNVYIESPGA